MAVEATKTDAGAGSAAGASAGAGAAGATDKTATTPDPKSGTGAVDTSKADGGKTAAGGSADKGAADDSLLGGDDKGAAPAAELELKFPEGFKAEEGLVTEFKGVAKELGLKAEQAQKFADFYVKSEQAKAEKSAAEAKAMRAEWKDAAAKDKEYGGEKFKENVQLANQAFKKFASPGLQAFFKETGLASHPEVVRHFFNLAKADAEPSGVKGGSPAVGGEVDAVAALTSFYSKPKS